MKSSDIITKRSFTFLFLAIFQLLFLCLYPIECFARKYKPKPDIIVDSRIVNNIKYEIVIRDTYREESRMYHQLYGVLADGKVLVPFEKWSELKFAQVEDRIFFIWSRVIITSENKEIWPSERWSGEHAEIAFFQDYPKPMIHFWEDFGSGKSIDEYVSLEGELIIPFHIRQSVKKIIKDKKIFYSIQCDDEEKGRPYGLINEELKWIFPFDDYYKTIEPCSDGSPFIIGKKSDNKCSIYNVSADEILPYTSITRILDTNSYIVGNDESFGIYSSELNSEIIPLHYKQIQPVKAKENYVMVNKDGVWGIMSVYGKEIIPTKYQMIKLVEANLAIVERNNRYGVFNMLSNSEMVSPDFEGIEIIDTNLIKYKLNGFWGVMNLNGSEIIPTTRGYTDINYIKGLKKFTYSMHGFKGECNSLGKQLSKIAVPVKDNSSNNNSGTSVATSSSNTRNETTTSTANSQGNQVRAYIETIPVQVWQPCGGCNGSGQCSVCYGSGWILSYNGNKSSCTACHGTGKCTSCAGHGGQNVVRYEQRTVYR